MKPMLLLMSVGLFVIEAFSLPSIVGAQGFEGFDTNYTSLFHDSTGSVLTLKTTFYWTPGRDNFHVHLIGSRGFTSNPSEFDVASPNFVIPITVFAHLDSIPGCWWGPEYGLFALDDSNSLLSVFPVEGYIYDPKIIGRVLLPNDTLNFGFVPIETDDSLLLNVQIDTGASIFRELLIPLNIQTPFFTTNTITPVYNKGYCLALPSAHNYFHFHPTEVKRYTDTTFLYDPIRKDSTMLILIGEGVAAGVSESVGKMSSIQISPNPSGERCTISLKEGRIDRVAICNIIGECLLNNPSSQSNILTINTSSFSAGVYFVEVVANQKIYHTRIVVAH